MIARALLGSLLLFAGALPAGPAAAQAPPPFSHADHLAREKTGRCTDCHDEGQEKPAVKLETCDFCHDTDSVGRDYSYPRRAKRLSVELPHARHARTNDCTACHDRTATDTQVAGEPIMPPGRCLDCHDQKQVTGVTKNCTKCHSRLTDAGEGPRHFLLRTPHSAHRRESCDTCHSQTPVDGRHGALRGGAGFCFDCHGERQVAAVPPACEACHDRSAKLIPGPRRLQVTFPHQKHAGEGKCVDCHEAGVTPKGGHGEARGFPEGCFSCHAKKQVAVRAERCESCHGGGRRLDRPANHQAASWSRRHGEASRWAAGRHGEGCESCHRADACTTCHQQAAPKNHNGLWRLRSHGRVAAWDRENCKACHESGQCVSCHRSTQPLNHQGIWNSLHGAVAQDRENDYCLTCHRSSACVSCHAGQTP